MFKVGLRYFLILYIIYVHISAWSAVTAILRCINIHYIKLENRLKVLTVKYAIPCLQFFCNFLKP